ncbi:hypothetical protein LSAT2_000941 [Lamellibrachia satsuma]|nr:hypothetical protein LSAT2_000941 [Lamellibrachia satsuma]
MPCWWFEIALLLLAVSSVMSRDTCYTLEKEVHITRKMTYEYSTGRTVRLTCAARVSLRKCEGMCESQTLPSVILFPGFKQECKCCQESRLVDRHVTLDQCFDGSQLVPGQQIELTIKEPDDCRCFSCV